MMVISSSHLVGHLADGNPYDVYLPPDPEDPNGFVHPDAPGEMP
jgi:hypothetical protein